MKENDEYGYGAYWASVRSFASYVAEELKRDPSLDEGDLLHETVDGSEWCIYYGKALRVLLHSSNDGYGQEQGFLPSGPSVTMPDLVCAAAFWALCADVREELEELKQKAETEEGETAS